MFSFSGFVATDAQAKAVFSCARAGHVRLAGRLSIHDQRSIAPGQGFVYHLGRSRVKRWTDGRRWADDVHPGGLVRVYREVAPTAATATATSHSSSATSSASSSSLSLALPAGSYQPQQPQQHAQPQADGLPQWTMLKKKYIWETLSSTEDQFRIVCYYEEEALKEYGTLRLISDAGLCLYINPDGKIFSDPHPDFTPPLSPTPGQSQQLVSRPPKRQRAATASATIASRPRPSHMRSPSASATQQSPMAISGLSATTSSPSAPLPLSHSPMLTRGTLPSSSASCSSFSSQSAPTHCSAPSSFTPQVYDPSQSCSTSPPFAAPIAAPTASFTTSADCGGLSLLSAAANALTPPRSPELTRSQQQQRAAIRDWRHLQQQIHQQQLFFHHHQQQQALQKQWQQQFHQQSQQQQPMCSSSPVPTLLDPLQQQSLIPPTSAYFSAPTQPSPYFMTGTPASSTSGWNFMQQQ